MQKVAVLASCYDLAAIEFYHNAECIILDAQFNTMKCGL